MVNKKSLFGDNDLIKIEWADPDEVRKDLFKEIKRLQNGKKKY